MICTFSEMTVSEAELRAMVEEAIIDAIDREEALMGFCSLIEENLAVPFTTTVLGVKVKVNAVVQSSDGYLVAKCSRGAAQQAIGLLDLPLPDPAPAGAEWIEAYRHWCR
jgi:hypothetical protein